MNSQNRRVRVAVTLFAVASVTAFALGAESLRPYVYRILRHKVVDGDTIHTELDLGFHIRVVYLARLEGVDAPELSTVAGPAVRDFVTAWCAKQQTLLAVSVANDKYDGRYVAELHGDFEQLSDVLLAKKLAKVYDGQGPRPAWADPELKRAHDAAIEATKELEAEKPAPVPDPAAPGRVVPAPLSPVAPKLGYWLTAETGVRHNASCRYYQKSKGRACAAGEGKACKVCGG